MTSESLEFIKWLITNYPPLFLLLLGLIVIIFDYIKSIKAFSVYVEKQPSGPRKNDKLFKVGLALIIMGIALSTLSYAMLNYPQYITVDGKIKYWDGTPVKFAAIKIDDIDPVTADEYGDFTIENVSRNINQISYRIRGLDYIPQNLRISHLDLWKHFTVINVTKPIYIIKGIVSDENNIPLNGAVVSIENKTCITSDGYYTINDACYNPKTEEFCRIIVLYEGILRYSKLLQILPSEYAHDMLIRNIDLSSPRITRVFGTVLHGDKPVVNAQVEIDGKKIITDNNGNYSIQEVSRKAKLWKVIINGSLIEGDIHKPLDIPPFIYDRSIKINIYL